MAGDDARRGRQSIRTDLAFGVDAVLIGTAMASDADDPVPTAAAAPPRASAPTSDPASPASRPTSTPPATSPTSGESTGGAVRGASALVTDLPESRAEREAALEDLRARHEAKCAHCTSVADRARVVFGEGDPEAPIVFVGEAPGEQEDRTGRPFVGRAGAKLDEMITAMGLAREGVYIANVLKTRPPDNRTPLQHEIDACGPWLAAQLRIIRPRVIVTLGGPAAKLLLDTTTGITRLRGTWGTWRDDDLAIPVMPTFHPAYMLRNYTVETRRAVWNDLQAAKARLAGD